MVCNTLQEFEERWKEKISKIEKSEFDENQPKQIFDGFLKEIMIFYHEKLDKENKTQGALLITEIFNDLDLAFQIALSNYNKRHGVSFSDKIFGMKHFNTDFNAVKNVINQ